MPIPQPRSRKFVESCDTMRDQLLERMFRALPSHLIEGYCTRENWPPTHIWKRNNIEYSVTPTFDPDSYSDVKTYFASLTQYEISQIHPELYAEFKHNILEFTQPEWDQERHRLLEKLFNTLSEKRLVEDYSTSDDYPPIHFWSKNNAHYGVRCSNLPKEYNDLNCYFASLTPEEISQLDEELYQEVSARILRLNPTGPANIAATIVSSDSPDTFTHDEPGVVDTTTRDVSSDLSSTFYLNSLLTISLIAGGTLLALGIALTNPALAITGTALTAVGVYGLFKPHNSTQSSDINSLEAPASTLAP